MRPRALAALLALSLLVGWGGPDDHSDRAASSANPRPGSAALAQGVAKTHGAKAQGASPPRGRVDCRRERCVALTYDDGPGLPTPRLLDVLRRHHARATFFMVGEMVQLHPGTARRIARAGHAVGVHTWDHSDLCSIPARQVRSQLARTAQVIRRVTGVNPTLMRPPYGSSNRRVRRIERQLGLAEIMWDVDTADWRDRNAGLVSARALRGARRNSVILMHDIRSTTVDAAGSLIQALRRRGFRLVTVPELLGRTKPGRSYYDSHTGRQVIR